MNIQPIVEGFGEVAAVPVLLRRFLAEASLHSWDVNRPIRKKRPQLVKEDSLREAVRLALLQPHCDAILILFDSDDDCPKTLAPDLQKWSQEQAGAVPCAVVMAQREYEAWFLATLESLRGKRGIRADAPPHPDPEAPRDAKGRLEDCMAHKRSYAQTTDQAALTQAFDLAAAYSRCRSFRKMVHAFGVLVQDSGDSIAVWPPPHWQQLSGT